METIIYPANPDATGALKDPVVFNGGMAHTVKNHRVFSLKMRGEKSRVCASGKLSAPDLCAIFIKH